MKKLLWMTIILLCFPLLTGSQDAEPTLTADELYDWSSELYFPQAIDLTLIARRRESAIAELSLTVSYRGSEPQLIQIDPATVNITESGGLFRYRWEVPQQDPPQLFSRIRYTWDIITADGEPYTITDDLEFTDTRVNWVQANDLQSQVNIFHGINQIDPDAVREGIRATYDLLFSNTQNRPIYTLLMYPQNIPIGCNRNDEDEPILRVRGESDIDEIECDLALADRIYQQDDYIVMNQLPPDTIQQMIISLLVEEYYTNQWESVAVPDWFLYGLQQFYDPRPKNIALTTAQQKSRAGDLLNLSELSVSPQVDIDTWQAQSIGLVLYLADTLGVQGLFDFADSISEYDTFAEAYEDITGQSLDLLIVAWQDWLFRSTTSQNYEYNPYLPDTPTPTPSATPTNTPTVTFTPSKTPNITRTPRPTITPIPPTSTITPLPAQSFSVQPTDMPPTPIPVESSSQLALNDESSVRLAVGGAVILGLLLILYLVLRRR